MIILGLHKDPWHNTAAALIRDDGDEGDNSRPRIVYIAEERLNRDKDSRAFPQEAIAACMRELCVKSYSEIDMVVTDYVRNGADWRADHFRTPCRTDIFLADYPAERLHIVNHHLLHACATYFSSPFTQAAVLIVDGRGSDEETQSLFHAQGNQIQLLEKTSTIGVGLMYAAVTQAIGFANLQEGKTMGLAPYGDPQFAGQLGDQHSDSTQPIFDFQAQFKGIETDYSRFCTYGNYQIAAPHAPIENFADQARAAFEAQAECERAMLHLAQHAQTQTGARNLCLSGGVALNSVANNKIRLSGLFDDVFINPAASDTGIALGAALYGYHMLAGRPRIVANSPFSSPFLGPSYSPQALRDAAQRHCTEGQYRIIEDHTFARATELLVRNHILGCVQGRSEMGPRALGNRSILMSPMHAQNKDVLNARVKHREAFRPFAPATPAECANDIFEIDRPSPYMLFICDVRPDKRHLVPAITHVDGTARLQTLTREHNGRFYDLVKAFGERTGVPVLLNTSFNVAGEPIVETPDDAIRCFLGTAIDALLLGDLLLLKPGIDA